MYGIEKKVRFNFICFTVIAILLMFNTVVFADDDVPDSCIGDNEETAYRAGLASGESIVIMAWKKIDDCDRIEYFESVVVSIVNRLTLPEYASQVTACRYAGYINGVMGAINDIYRECEVLCYSEGEIIGDFAARAYCELSLALGGLDVADDFIRAPLQLCGFNFEFACDVTYMYTTFTYSNSLGFCEQYTLPPYTDVWDQVRNNQCAYDIEEKIAAL